MPPALTSNVAWERETKPAMREQLLETISCILYYLFVVVGQYSRMVAHCIDRFHYQLDMQNIDLQWDLIHTLMQTQHQHLAGSVDMQTRRSHPIILSWTILEIVRNENALIDKSIKNR